jgi:hypothetical protein
MGFSSMIEEVLGGGERGNVDLGWDYPLIRELIASEAHLLDAVTEPRFVERDLWAMNVMMRRQDRRDHRPRACLPRRSLIEAGIVALELPVAPTTSSAATGSLRSTRTRAVVARCTRSTSS